jgi:exonuclease III
MDEVKDMLNRNMFDILFIAETKIDKTVSLALVTHTGYGIARQDRAKGAGGMLVYTREELSVYRRKKLEPTDIEAICLDVSDNSKSRFMVCGCYRSPGKCKELEFLTSLSSAAETMFR